jgi:hypothetical protein
LTFENRGFDTCINTRTSLATHVFRGASVFVVRWYLRKPRKMVLNEYKLIHSIIFLVLTIFSCLLFFCFVFYGITILFLFVCFSVGLIFFLSLLYFLFSNFNPFLVMSEFGRKSYLNCVTPFVPEMRSTLTMTKYENT